MWNEEHKKSFKHVKKIVSQEVMLAYPHFNDKFVMHADASARQLGAVITQHDRPIAFYNKRYQLANKSALLPI